MHLPDFDDHRSAVSTTSADLSYVDLGDGPTALFIHGIGTNAYLWHDVIARLDGRRRIAFDWPLHGRSPARADQNFALGALADVIEEFCAALDLHDVDL